jgi:hypothetical protein
MFSKFIARLLFKFGNRVTKPNEIGCSQVAMTGMDKQSLSVRHLNNQTTIASSGDVDPNTLRCYTRSLFDWVQCAQVELRCVLN